MSNPYLQLSQKQNLVTAAMMTSLQILQMTNLQLQSYVQNLMDSNVVIDISAAAEDPADVPLPVQFDYYDPYAAQMEYSHSSVPVNPDADREQFIRDKARGTSIIPDLDEQASVLPLCKEERLIVSYLISLLDRNGRLEESDEELSRLLGQEPAVIRRCVEALQSLEPAGVGARSLSECLILQLRRMPEDTQTAQKIVEGFLPELSRKQYRAIAKALGVPTAAVMAASEQICATNPKPFNGLSNEEATGYIVPDIRVFCDENGLHCVLNDRFIPKIRIDPHYLALIRDKGFDKEAREYLQKCYTQASDIQRYISYRSSTLRLVVDYILRTQQAFFREGPGHRVSMSNREIADALNLHDSTISRAVSGKFFECDWGVFPLKSLFSRSLQAADPMQSVDYDHVVGIMKKMIAAEPADRPLSDQAISDALADMGITLSRRTVSKYRGEQNIPSAAARSAGKRK